jgi:hypothetical protein
MEMQLTEPGRAVVGSKVKLVVGIFFTVVGVLLALDNLDIVYAGDVLRYWPVLLIVIGVLKFNDAGSRGMACCAIVAGALLLAHNTHWLRFSFRMFWPLLLIAVGVVIVLRAFGVIVPTAFVLTAMGPSVNSIWAVFDNRKQVRPVNEMAGKRLVAFLGGHQLELTEPASYDGPIVIEAMAMWGGIEIRVPPGWEVIADVVPIMGGIDVKTSAARGGRQLIVRGLVFMAGMEIKSAVARMQ